MSINTIEKLIIPKSKNKKHVLKYHHVTAEGYPDNPVLTYYCCARVSLIPTIKTTRCKYLTLS